MSWYIILLIINLSTGAQNFVLSQQPFPTEISCQQAIASVSVHYELQFVVKGGCIQFRREEEA